MTGPISFQLHAGTQPVDAKLLAFLRLFCMTQESLDFWLQSENTSNLMHEECGIETEVEIKSWSFLKSRCQLLLQLYPITREVLFIYFKNNNYISYLTKAKAVCSLCPYRLLLEESFSSQNDFLRREYYRYFCCCFCLRGKSLIYYPYYVVIHLLSGCLRNFFFKHAKIDNQIFLCEFFFLFPDFSIEKFGTLLLSFPLFYGNGSQKHIWRKSGQLIDPNFFRD